MISCLACLCGMSCLVYIITLHKYTTDTTCVVLITSAQMLTSYMPLINSFIAEIGYSSFLTIKNASYHQQNEHYIYKHQVVGQSPSCLLQPPLSLFLFNRNTVEFNSFIPSLFCVPILTTVSGARPWHFSKNHNFCIVANRFFPHVLN